MRFLIIVLSAVICSNAYGKEVCGKTVEPDPVIWGTEFCSYYKSKANYLRTATKYAKATRCKVGGDDVFVLERPKLPNYYIVFPKGSEDCHK